MQNECFLFRYLQILIVDLQRKFYRDESGKTKI